MAQVPSLIGEVLWLPDDNSLEIIVCDCDESADPRLWIGVNNRRQVFDDYPHNSPNYR